MRRWQWQRLQAHFLKTHPATQQTADNPQHAAWQALITDLLALNDAVDTTVNAHLDDLLQARVDQKQDTHDIHLVRRAFNHYFARVRRDYDTSQPPVDSQWYIQAFQAEYSFVQQQVATDKIPVALATALYTEINRHNHSSCNKHNSKHKKTRHVLSHGVFFYSDAANHVVNQSDNVVAAC